MSLVRFFEEGVVFKLPHPRKTSRWIAEVVRLEKATGIGLNVIFCTDRFLGQVNKEYLNHNTLTDIITFDYGDEAGISGDIFISIDRVRDNSRKFRSEFDEELHRVIIHGVLHLLGYKDKSASAKKLMRKREDAYLSLRQFHVKPGKSGTGH